MKSISNAASNQAMKLGDWLQAERELEGGAFVRAGGLGSADGTAASVTARTS